MNLEIHVSDKSNPATWTKTELNNREKLPEMEIRWGLPVKAETIGDIVFNSPCQGKGMSVWEGLRPSQDFSPHFMAGSPFP